MENTLKDREIFAVGTWFASTGKIDVTSEMLDQVLESFNELNSKVPGFAVPIKLGHNKRIGEPAMGYATNVRRTGTKLLADFTDVPSEIVDAVTAKRYNSVSVELWPEINYGGMKFNQVLGGVALLGAEWPAVKGLKPVFAFADSGAPLTLSQEEVEMPKEFSQEQHDALVEAAVTKAVTEASAPLAAKAAELTAQVAALTTERDTAKTALSVFQDDAEKKAIGAVIEAAEKAGKIVPANKAKVTAFADALRKSIKSEDRTATLKMFTDFVEGLPVKATFGEKGQDHSGSEGTSAQDQVNSAVKRLQDTKPKLSYKDALAQVFAEDEGLKTRYAEENR